MWAPLNAKLQGGVTIGGERLPKSPEQQEHFEYEVALVRTIRLGDLAQLLPDDRKLLGKVGRGNGFARLKQMPNAGR